MEQYIFHIAVSADWQQRDKTYSPAEFGHDGFIHCSSARQLTGVARERYAGRNDLVLLCIDTAALRSSPRYENTGGGAELFPHVYSAIELSAIIASDVLSVDDRGVMHPGRAVTRYLAGATT